MSESQNVNSPAKAISDYQLTYDRLMRMRADLIEIIRLGQVTEAANPPDAEQLATVDTWIAEIRTHMKFGS